MLTLKLSRRDFVKAGTALTLLAAGVGKYSKDRHLFAKASAREMEEGAEYIKTICTFCAVGCGIKAKVKNGKLISIEPWEEHPINRGRLCVKGASI